MIFRMMVLAVFCFSFVGGVAQNKKSSDTNSFDPKNVDERFVPNKTKKKKKFGRTYQARNEANKRMEKNWKEKEKIEKNVSGERKADKSQPPYFGHKRPPKIRPQGKRKVCKVCHITH